VTEVKTIYGFNMESTYQGIYTYKNAQGKIEAVQVEDSIGKASTIPINEYIQRRIEPPAESLPDKHDYLH
jgi:hypothetical protein